MDTTNPTDNSPERVLRLHERIAELTAERDRARRIARYFGELLWLTCGSRVGKLIKETTSWPEPKEGWFVP